VTDLAAEVRDRVACAPVPWLVRLDGFYAHAKPAGVRLPDQGWKIHVSTRPENARQTLTRCADVLIRQGIPFKFGQDIGVAYTLLSARYERTGAAKFLVAYPPDPESCAKLLHDLGVATAGLPAARVIGDRRYRADAPVYYRFGAIAIPASLAADGKIVHPLRAPDGSLVPDDRLRFCPPPWAPSLPVDSACAPVALADAAVVGGRYRITAPLRPSARGGVFRAVDLKSAELVVIKQARAHTGVGLDGSDAIDRLGHEASALRALAGTGLVPQVRDFFEAGESGFLVLAHLPGVPLRRWLRDRWRPPAGPPPAAFAVAEALAAGLAAIHQAGWVLGDASPNNCLVAEPAGGRRPVVWFVDLEAATLIGDIAARQYTPGYGVPPDGRADQAVAQPAADLYALGGIFSFLVTAADPSSDPWDELADGADGNVRKIWSAGLALRAADPQARPSAATVASRLSSGRAKARPARRDWAVPRHESCVDLMADLAGDGRRYLLATLGERSAEALWPAPAWLPGYDPASFDHGAAGPLLVLASAVRPDSVSVELVLDAADWLADHAARSAVVLPGLHSGRAGALWALAQAADFAGQAEAAGLGRSGRRQSLLGQIGRLAADLPADGRVDLAHGLAGAGLARLRLWQATGAEHFAAQARALASRLATDAAVLSDLTTRTGLATFLGAAAGLPGAPAARLAAQRLVGEVAEAAQRLLDRVRTMPVESALTALSAERGIAGALRCAWVARQVGAPWPSELNAQAAQEFIWYACAAPSGFAHGIAGWLDGLLNAIGPGRHAPDPAVCAAADRLAAYLARRRGLRAGLSLVPDDSGHGWCADFAHGVAGVSYVAGRYAAGGRPLWDLAC
jgi:tRNA A-37 threonylcarbamoyl transferase component Bud32